MPVKDMYKCKYPHLFSPLKIGDVVFKNRIFAAPTGLFYADPAHRPHFEARSFYERKALGGCASVCVGDAMVDGVHGSHGQFGLAMDDEEAYPAINRLAMDISRHNCVPTIEMFHGGTAAGPSYMKGNEIYGPQDEVISGGLGGREVRAKGCTREIMDRIIEKHVNAALKAKACGFKMMMIHAGHGFLLHEFLSPTLNHRTDEYGGCPENNMRFPLEVVTAIRKAVGPNFPLEMRISGSEVYEGGYGIDYGCKIAEAFDGLVDIIHVSCGSHEDMRVFTVTHPSMFLEDGVNVKYAAEIKKHVKKSLVATVGALADPALMEEIIASGKADIVELGRGLICDPDLPNKAREGREDEIVKCTRCLTCFSNLIKKGQTSCALNPELVDAHERKFSRLAPAKKKVMIAGGGIAGMQAAITCAKRGHEVILVEKSDRLGGVMHCEDEVPFKIHVKEYLAQQAKKVEESDVKVMLNTQATPALAEELLPDVIIAALGAVQAVPSIPGIENAVSAIEVYKNPELAGKKAIILGAGLVGAELSVFLSDKGTSCELVEMGPMVNVGDNMLHGLALGLELGRCGVVKNMNAKAVEIGKDYVIAETAEGAKRFEGDIIINATGLTPCEEAAESLRFCAPTFYRIGDCEKPSTIHEANRIAYNISLDIGER